MFESIDCIALFTKGLSLEPTGFIYLYLYPIFSSIVAGLIFWLIFSFLPERKRKKSFGIGIFNDLLLLNGQIFSYFDFLLRHTERSPSFFQEKIHACSLSKDELSLALQNKVISKDYLYDQAANQMLIVGEELINKVSEIDVVINRLYSFNYFLSSQEIKLLRSIYGNIHTYMPYVESNIHRDKALVPVNPSISFMAHSAYALQENYREFRKLVFSRKDCLERDFYLSKILRLYNLCEYKDCIKECNFSVKEFPQDANFFKLRIIECYYAINKKDKVYKLLREYPLSSDDLIGFRNILSPLLTDSEIEKIVIEKTSLVALNAMKDIVIKESAGLENFLSGNEKLQKYFSSESM